MKRRVFLTALGLSPLAVVPAMAATNYQSVAADKIFSQSMDALFTMPERRAVAAPLIVHHDAMSEFMRQLSHAPIEERKRWSVRKDFMEEVVDGWVRRDWSGLVELYYDEHHLATAVYPPV